MIYFTVTLATAEGAQCLVAKCFCIPAIQREEEKIKRSLKDAAKNGDKDVCVILAKEVVRSRKAVNKIYTAKAQIKSVELTMKNQLGEDVDSC